MTRGRTPRRGRPCWPALRSPVLAAVLVAAVVLGLVVMHAVDLSGATAQTHPAPLPATTHSTVDTSGQAVVHPVAASTNGVLPDPGHAPAVGTASGDRADTPCPSCVGGTHSGALMTCTLVLLITLVALVPPRPGELGAPLLRLRDLPRSVPARLPCPRAPSLLQIGVCRT